MKSIKSREGGENGFYTTYFQATVIYSFENDKLFHAQMFQRQCNCVINHTNIYMKMIHYNFTFKGQFYL